MRFLEICNKPLYKTTFPGNVSINLMDLWNMPCKSDDFPYEKCRSNTEILIIFASGGKGNITIFFPDASHKGLLQKFSALRAVPSQT